MAKIPDRIGKYKIVKEIARGGMSAVYKAVHPTLKRFVTLKKLTLRGRSTVAERFKREARIMMDFKNDHIAQVYDHFKEGTYYYIVEEFVDGISLEELIRRERYLPCDVAMLIFRDCCKALKYAHDKNVVHRDIKPGNILVSGKGEVKLVDFGIAANQEEDEGTLTREGMTLGTPSYMSPEQIADTKSVDKRADIYSLGVMLYEMVTGKKPFPGGFTPETISRIQRGRYKPPKKINPRVGSAANTIIRRSVRPKPKRRFQDLDDVFRILNMSIREKDPRKTQDRIRDYVENRGSTAGKRPSRLRPAVLSALIALGAVAAVAGFLYQQGSFFEWFAPERFGSLIVSVRIARSLEEEGEPITVRAVLNREKLNENTRLDDVRLTFRESRRKVTEDYLVLESQKIYLKPDHYRVKVSLASKVFWDTLYLEPRTMQRRKPATEEARIVEVVLDDLPSLPLDVRYRVVDETTGADITTGTVFSIFRDSRWLMADRLVLSGLRTGEVYRYRFERTGYYPKLFHLIIRPDQTILDFQVSLIPRPGTLLIRANTEGIRLLLDGSETYLSAGEVIEAGSLEPTAAEPMEISLFPGEYLLTAEQSSKITRDILLNIQADEKVELEIDGNRKAGTLDLKIRNTGR